MTVDNPIFVYSDDSVSHANQLAVFSGSTCCSLQSTGQVTIHKPVNPRFRLPGV